MGKMEKDEVKDKEAKKYMNRILELSRDIRHSTAVDVWTTLLHRNTIQTKEDKKEQRIGISAKEIADQFGHRFLSTRHV